MIWRLALAVLSFIVLTSNHLRSTATTYDFESVLAKSENLGSLSLTYPSINNNGLVAFGTVIFDPIDNRLECAVLRGDGTETTVFANLTDAGFTLGAIQWVVINDAGAVGMHFLDDSASFPRHRLLRINTDGSITNLLTADTGGSLPYLEFARSISMNNSGQIAVLAKNLDNSQSILRVDGSGVTEIAHSGPTLSSLRSPTINDLGVVAFKAVVTAESIVTGNGGPLTEHARPGGCQGASYLPAVINNSGRILGDCGGPPIYTTQGGTATILLAGTEDPIFSELTPLDWIDMNNLGVPVFGTKAPGLGPFGIFTGNNPFANRVIGSGDTALSGTVTEVRLGTHSINDSGQIAFLLQVQDAGGSTVSHVVRATPPRASQTIIFGPLSDRVFGDASFTVSATASSGLPVSFTATGSCTVAANTVTITGTGNCTITASQSGNASYEPAPEVAQTFAIGRASQTISFGTLANRTILDSPFTVSATASSGLPVTLNAAGTCSVAGTSVTLTAIGSCTITASQTGNGSYQPAPDVSRTFTITQVSQTITFGSLPNRFFGDPPFSVIATASSGLPIGFAAAGNCAVAGNTVTIAGAGSCTVIASQAGNQIYLPAPDVAQSFSIARSSQTIGFAILQDRTLGDPPFTVAATASSSLPVSFTAAGGCTASGTTVTLTVAGLCSITASQAGNNDFMPAPTVLRLFNVVGAPAGVIIREAHFAAGTEGFIYLDDAFRGTSQPAYASGGWIASGGFKNGGGLQVGLGGIDALTVLGMSGGWRTSFTLSASTKVMVYVRGSVTQSADYESNERSQLLVSIDGILRPAAPNDYLAQVLGDGNLGSARTTGWRLYAVNLGTLNAGAHTLIIGGYNNQKTTMTESTTVLVDDVVLMDSSPGAQAAVASLNFQRFKDNIQTLAGNGDRTQGSASNINAGNWIENELEAAGYTVEHHNYTYLGASRQNIYATKIGSIFPDQMYIVSAHMDGRGAGGAADDDASGSSLVLEAARALAGLQTAVSVRFIFWNNEETGLNGSTAYVNTQNSQQGVENPVGSGLYPEPRWLGIIQHDMILFDHGLPVQLDQIPGADIDVEYQASASWAYQAQQLANALGMGNQTHSTDYPAQIGSNMNYTDSMPFRNYTAAVSVRENQRVAEIGNWSNPHWHRSTDVYTTFSEADFRLGFNAVQMTLGTVAGLAGATIVP